MHIPPQIEIRLLQAADEALLAQVPSEVFDDPLDAQATHEFLRDPRHHLVVAITEEKIVGFVSGVHYLHPDKPHPEFWINEVSVASTHQGQGLGKKLMQATLDLARSLGCEEAWVLTERTNMRALNLYAAVGGKEAKPETVMFDFDLTNSSN